MNCIVAPLLSTVKRRPAFLVARKNRASCSQPPGGDNWGMSNDAPSKKAKITDEHREEARRLREIYEERKQGGRPKGMTQAQAGAHYKIGTQSMVGHYLWARSALTLLAAKKFASWLDCQIDDFSPRLAKEDRLGQQTELGAISADELRSALMFALAQATVSGMDPRTKPESFCDMVIKRIGDVRAPEHNEQNPDAPEPSPKSSEEVQDDPAKQAAAPRLVGGHTHLGNAPKSKWSANEKKTANGTEGGTGGTT